MYVREGLERKGLRYWTAEDVAECIIVEGYPGAVLGEVSGQMAERLRGYEEQVVKWFEQRRATGSEGWVVV